MRLSELLRHFPELTVQAGQPGRTELHRLDVLSAGAAPTDGTLYLHPDAATAHGILRAWAQRYALHHLALITPPGQQGAPDLPSEVALIEYQGDPLPLDLSARVLRVLLAEHPRSASEAEQARDELLEDILTRPGRPSAEQVAHAASLGVNLGQLTQVMVVGGRSTDAGIPRRQGMYSAAHRAVATLPRAQVFRVGAQVVVLAPRDPQAVQALLERLAAELQRAAPTAYTLAALGESVNDAAGLPHGYRTARAALEITLENPRKERWVTFDQVRDLLLYREIRRNPELMNLIEGSLTPLLKLSGEYRRTLLHTLAAYLEENRSVSRAATRLGIHPNTMKYRLKRLDEFIDLHDMSGSQFVMYYLAAQLNR